jgi:hypothetical protein
MKNICQGLNQTFDLGYNPYKNMNCMPHSNCNSDGDCREGIRIITMKYSVYRR